MKIQRSVIFILACVLAIAVLSLFAPQPYALTSADNFYENEYAIVLSGFDTQVNKEKEKAAEYSAMSGLCDKVSETKIVADALLGEHMNGNI